MPPWASNQAGAAAEEGALPHSAVCAREGKGMPRALGGCGGPKALRPNGPGRKKDGRPSLHPGWLEDISPLRVSGGEDAGRISRTVHREEGGACGPPSFRYSLPCIKFCAELIYSSPSDCIFFTVLNRIV